MLRLVFVVIRLDTYSLSSVSICNRRFDSKKLCSSQSRLKKKMIFLRICIDPKMRDGKKRLVKKFLPILPPENWGGIGLKLNDEQSKIRLILALHPSVELDMHS